jgi:hypothetical protein
MDSLYFEVSTAFEPFYSQERRTWDVQFRNALFEYKANDELYAGTGEKRLHELDQLAIKWMRAYPARYQADIAKLQEKGDLADEICEDAQFWRFYGRIKRHFEGDHSGPGEDKREHQDDWSPMGPYEGGKGDGA